MIYERAKDAYNAGNYEKALGHFEATKGWEDVFAQKKIDHGRFYASKDNEYPTKDGGSRRINWGWAQVPPQSAQTLPRVITFNAAARTLEQAPIEVSCAVFFSVRPSTPLLGA